MGVQQNIESILSGFPAGEDFRSRLGRLECMEASDRGFVSDHSIGVAHFASELAAAIGMSERDCKALRHAARWHDIGKLAIPEDILRKPGKLDPGEKAIMNMHAAAGAELLGPEAPRLMIDIARFHHERYDGHGYEGLKGEDIPLAARVVNVADVHDALVKERDYKKGMPEEDALRLMTADVPSPGFGRRAFDPYLLRCFVAMRVADPTFVTSPEGRQELLDFAVSDPMNDVDGGPEANAGWLVKATGHRVRYVTAPNGNRRMAEMRGPAGELKYRLRSEPSSDNDFDSVGVDFRQSRESTLKVLLQC